MKVNYLKKELTILYFKYGLQIWKNIGQNMNMLQL